MISSFGFSMPFCSPCLWIGFVCCHRWLMERKVRKWTKPAVGSVASSIQMCIALWMWNSTRFNMILSIQFLSQNFFKWQKICGWGVFPHSSKLLYTCVIKRAFIKKKLPQYLKWEKNSQFRSSNSSWWRHNYARWT